MGVDRFEHNYSSCGHAGGLIQDSFRAVGVMKYVDEQDGIEVVRFEGKAAAVVNNVRQFCAI
jgi:hypothetical protein